MRTVLISGRIWIKILLFTTFNQYGLDVIIFYGNFLVRGEINETEC